MKPGHDAGSRERAMETCRRLMARFGIAAHELIAPLPQIAAAAELMPPPPSPPLCQHLGEAPGHCHA